LVEKPNPEDAPSTLSIIGRYILQPEVFYHLDKHEKGTGNEIQLTDAMAKTIEDVPFHGLRFEGERFDCGHSLGFIEANIAFALSRDDLAGPVEEIIRGLI
jgi:UTP--glucose-1-phosphate uridylyltransferase